MANGFSCTVCGWQETDHSGRVTEWSEADKDERRKVKRGYRLPLLADKDEHMCDGYTASRREVAYEKKQAKEALHAEDDGLAGWIA